MEVTGKPLVSIIIVSYNVEQLLLACVRSIKKHFSFSFEIIVVDNNSSDNSITALRSEDKEIRIIENKENKGFSEANNQAIALANGELILLLNPDTEILDTSINDYLTAFETAANKKLIMGPALQNSDGSFQHSAWKFPVVWQHLAELLFLSRWIDPSLYDRDSLLKTCEVDFVSGAALLTSAENMKALQGLDATLFWMDDADICYRNKIKGGQTWYYPECVIRHHIGQSSKRNWNKVISNQLISKLKFYRKHGNYGAFLFSALIYFLQIITRIPLFFIAGFLNSTYFKKSKAYAYSFGKFFQYLLFNNKAIS
jgi:GT2 family glycosyltransferase